MDYLMQGTTPVISFVTSFTEDEADALNISISQEDKIIIEKTIEDVLWQKKLIYFPVKQEETFLFNPHKLARAQARARLKDGRVLETERYYFVVEPADRKEVI